MDWIPYCIIIISLHSFSDTEIKNRKEMVMTKLIINYRDKILKNSIFNSIFIIISIT